MPSIQRGCRCSSETYVAVKNVTRHPMLYSQLNRRDGEGAINAEELFANDRPFSSKAERVDELRALILNIIDWAISFLSKANRASVRTVYFEGKTVKEHSADEVVTVYAVYKRLNRSYPVMREIILEEIEGLNPETRAEFSGSGGAMSRAPKAA